MSNTCPVCDSDISDPKEYSYKNHFNIKYSCARCGKFDVRDLYKDSLQSTLGNDKKKIAILSHWIRTKHKANTPGERGRTKIILLDKQIVETILKQRPPTPAEQADNFVRWLGDKIEYGRHYIRVRKHRIQAIIGATNEVEFNFVLGHLKKKGIIEFNSGLGGGKDILADVTLTFSSWEYYEELKQGAVDSRKAFMAMQYGDEQLNKIVEDVFKPAVEQTGFDLFKLTERPKAGLIDDRLRVEIQTSRFLIADLTHENAGAYWEAGYAEGLGKPVIYTCKKEKFEEQKTHFDTNHHLTITWDNKKLEEAAKELKATIRATLPGEAKLADE